MAAPFKRSRTKTIAQIANEVINEVKKDLKGQDENVCETHVEVCIIGHGARPFGNYFPNDYCDVTIKVGKTKWEGLDKYDVSALKYELGKYTKEFDGVETQDVFFTYGNFTPDVDAFPCVFRKFGKPCKEFEQLAKLVEKKYGNTLAITDLYHVSLFGKNGEYRESGERQYAAFNGKKCLECIEKIKSFGRKKTKMEIVNVDDIDTDYSAKYLTECYGVRERELSVKTA